MKAFQIKFKHVSEEYYTAKVSAETEEEAKEKFEEDPFDFLSDEQPYKSDGQGVSIEEIKELKKILRQLGA